MANPLLLLHHASFSTAASKMSVAVLSASLLLIVLIPLASCSHAQDSTIDSVEIGQRSQTSSYPLSENRFLNLRDEYRRGPVVVIVLRGYPGYHYPLAKVSSTQSIVPVLKQKQGVLFWLSGQDRKLAKQAERFLVQEDYGPDHIGSG